MKKLILVFLSLFSFAANAQTSNWQWGVSLSSAAISNDIGNSVTTDASDNVYTTGSLNGQIFVQKLNGLTNAPLALYEVSTVGSTCNSIYYSAGFIYVTGGFKGTNIDFHGGWVLSSGWSGLTDIFILKLDTSLNIIWAKSFMSDANGTGSIDSYGYSIVIVAGSIYTTGCFRSGSLVDFDPGNGTYNLVNGGIFISKLDQFGNFSWAGKITGSSSGTSVGQSLAVANGFVYYTGKFYGTNIDFNPNSGTDLYTAGGGGSIFVLKLDTNGIYSNTWTGGVGGTGYGIAIENNFIYVTGLWPSSTTGDIFILKLDNNLNPPIWINHFGGISSFYGGAGKSISVVNNIIYTIGSFTDSVTFGGATLYSSGAYDVFVSKLHIDGSYIWAGSIGGVGSEGGSSLSVDPTHQNVYIAGNYGTSSIIIGPDTLPPPNFSDIFTAKLSCTPPLVSVTPPGPITFCAGNSAVLTAIGGQTYIWSNGAVTQNINVTAAGSYHVIGTDSYGCSSSPSNIITLTINSLPTPTIFVADTMICPAANTNLTVSNSQTYIWSNGSISQIINIPTGSYSVTVTDVNGCTGSANILITEFAIPTVNINPDTVYYCFGSSAQLNSSCTGTGLSFIWSNGSTDSLIDNLSEGTYYLTVTDVCQTSVTSYGTVIMHSAISPIITQSGNMLICSNAVNYQWYFNSTSSTILGIDHIWIPTINGNYIVIITDDFGCSASDTFSITNVGINELNNEDQVKLFPNPAKENITIQLSPNAMIYKFELTDVLGRIIETQIINESSIQIDIHELPSGIYFVKLQGNGSKTIKLIKE